MEEKKTVWGQKKYALKNRIKNKMCKRVVELTVVNICHLQSYMRTLDHTTSHMHG